MLKWISKRLNLDDTTIGTETEVPTKDLKRATPQENQKDHKESTHITSTLVRTKTPVDQLEPLYKGSLPDDFWTILVHIPYTFGSNDLEEVRKSTYYQDLKAEHEAKLANSAVYTPVQQQHQERSSSNGSTQKKMVDARSNTSTESSQPLQSNTKSTSHRPL